MTPADKGQDSAETPVLPPEPDLWFLPGPAGDEDSDLPWPVAAREGSLDPAAWLAAERAEYRAILRATVPLVRLGERLARSPEAAERLALESVASALRAEGVWLGPERIALYRALRLSGAGEDARALARAAWAVRRLLAPGQGAGARAGQGLSSGLPRDLRAFLGRQAVSDPAPLAAEDRAVGGDLDLLGPRLAGALERLGESHPLLRGAYAFAWWRTEGITPWDELLEPTVAAMRIGAEGLAPFLPLGGPVRLDRHALDRAAAAPSARLAVFCAAAEQGALAALMVLDRAESWSARAQGALSDLSGRTPPRLVALFRRLPLVTAELVAAEAGCSAMSARRNLALMADRGLVREVTGQARYRFWTARL